jgi:dsRNA-specific ribonuclease
MTESPIILLDPIKKISDYCFSYSLQGLKQNPKSKSDYRKSFKKKNGLTTSQGRPIFSAVQIYKHYLTQQQWDRATQLPSVLANFERMLHCHSLIAHLGEPLNPTFIQWATQATGTSSGKKCYETLETYGDTILKLAGTLLAYNKYENDDRADENRVCRMKDSFVTNMFLFKIGIRNLDLNKYMRIKDPDPKLWSPPFTKQAHSTEILQCTGKNIADGVESLLGAFFMSTNLFKTLRFISDIQLVPLH